MNNKLRILDSALALGNRAFEAGALSIFDYTDDEAREKYKKAYAARDAALEILMAEIKAMEDSQ